MLLMIKWLICLIKKLNPIATELFMRGRKLNISFVFIRPTYFSVPTNSRVNSKFPNDQ